MLMFTRAERMAWARTAAQAFYARGATRVWAFGSLRHDRVQDLRSDIDVAVEGLPAGLVDGLTAGLARAVPCRVDALALESTAPEVRASCLAGAVLLPREASTPLPARGPSRERADPLYLQRLRAVAGLLREAGARTVLDLGCGRAWLAELLVRGGQVDRVLGVDLNDAELNAARTRLRRTLPAAGHRRISLRQGLVTWRDPEFTGHDAVVAVEVIEHLAPPQLAAFTSVVFGYARPAHVLVTTPNAEYNALFGLRPGQRRIPDHHFEWSRAEFAGWGADAARRHGYAFRTCPVGPAHQRAGSPTQLGLFTLGGPEPPARAKPRAEPRSGGGWTALLPQRPN